VLVVFLYVYGGEAEYFDYIYIGALCVSCIFCWKDKDSFGALVVLLCYWCLSKPLYAAPDTPLYWFLTYGGSLVIAVYYFHHLTAKVLLAYIVFAASVETYWWYTEYAGKPRLIYYIGLIALTVWLRQLLYNRIFIMSEYFGYSSGKITLDVYIGGIFYSYYVLVVLMITEYFVRHLTTIKSILIIYNLYTPASAFLSTLTLGVVYMHYFYNQSQKHLSA
jgi:hypothetical protein